MSLAKCMRRLRDPLCMAILAFVLPALSEGAASAASGTSVSLSQLVVVRRDIPAVYRGAVGTTTCFTSGPQFAGATGGPPASRLRVDGFEGACSAIWLSVKARVRIDSTTARFRNAAGARDYWMWGRNTERAHGGVAIRVARVGAQTVAFTRRNLGAYGAGVALLFREGRYTVLLNVSGLPDASSLAAQFALKVDGRLRRA